MKSILHLTRAITDKNYYNKQFEETAEEKNILFVNPELSGKQMYKALLPYFSMYNEKVFTAITGIAKYNEEHHLRTIGDVTLTQDELLWADYIVFPFTTQNLWQSKNGAESFYDKIRRVNNQTKIIFTVDFNFYELSVNHPYHSIFADKTNFLNTLSNIWYSDIVMVSNIEFQLYLDEALNKESQTTFKGIPTTLRLNSMPFIFDAEIMLENLEYDPEQPTKIINRKIVKQVENAAQIVKQEDLKQKSKKINANGKNRTSTGNKKSGSNTTSGNQRKPIVKKPATTGTKPSTKPVLVKKSNTTRANPAAKPAGGAKTPKTGNNLPENK